VTFRYRSNGRLRVEASVPGTEQKTHLELERVRGLSGEGVARWKNAVCGEQGFDVFDELVDEVLAEDTVDRPHGGTADDDQRSDGEGENKSAFERAVQPGATLAKPPTLGTRSPEPTPARDDETTLTSPTTITGWSEESQPRPTFAEVSKQRDADDEPEHPTPNTATATARPSKAMNDAASAAAGPIEAARVAPATGSPKKPGSRWRLADWLVVGAGHIIGGVLGILLALLILWLMGISLF
jgi:hypothetical protein